MGGGGGRTVLFAEPSTCRLVHVYGGFEGRGCVLEARTRKIMYRREPNVQG